MDVIEGMRDRKSAFTLLSYRLLDTRKLNHQIFHNVSVYGKVFGASSF